MYMYGLWYEVMILFFFLVTKPFIEIFIYITTNYKKLIKDNLRI